jgi:hypothetical protein
MAHMSIKRSLAVILIGLLSSACAPLVNVRISSSRDASALDKHTYVLFPGDERDPQFKEFAAYVDRALTARGYAPSVDPTTADLVILVSYGIGQPTPRDMHVPMYAQTERSNGWELRQNREMTTSDGTFDMPLTAIYGDVYTGIVPVSQYGRWADVVAFDAQEYARTQTTAPVWKTTITSRGSSNDLRQVFPIMIAGAAPLLGADTNGPVSIDLTLESPQVRAILGQTK